MLCIKLNFFFLYYIAPQHREVHKVILKIKDEIHSQTTSSSGSSNGKGNNANFMKKVSLNEEGNSTSGVDSTGSSSCSTKDFDHEPLSNNSSIVI